MKQPSEVSPDHRENFNRGWVDFHYIYPSTPPEEHVKVKRREVCGAAAQTKLVGLTSLSGSPRDI